MMGKWGERLDGGRKVTAVEAGEQNTLHGTSVSVSESKVIFFNFKLDDLYNLEHSSLCHFVIKTLLLNNAY